MKLLFVGEGKGSWEIRGRQLGGALGARVTTTASSDDFAWADVIVIVKRAIAEFGERAVAATRASDTVVVWDAVDFWAQPDSNSWPLPELVGEVAMVQGSLRRRGDGLALVIGATQAMANDLATNDLVGSTAYLPHHYRPGLRPVPLRSTLTTVAYEGTRKYLGSWAKHLQQACDRLGLQFVINPPDLRIADLVVAFRGEHWDGEVCRRWKSGVKVVNAMAAGVPLLSQPSAAFDELRPMGTIVERPEDLEAAIASWQPLDRREEARQCALMRGDEFQLETVARQYRALLERTWRRAA